MSMRIITGCTGTTHVTSNNDGEFNQAIFGEALVVLSNGNKLDAEIVNNNLVTVKDGDLVMQGRHALIEPNTTQDMDIDTGAIDIKRNDLIVAQYTLDTITGYEDITLVVKKGEESSGAAVDPICQDGVIRTGATLVEYPLYRVRIEGINIVGLDKLFEPIDNLTEEIAATKSLANSVQTQVTELEASVNDKLTWKFLDEKTGALPISLPEDYKELLIEVRWGTSIISIAVSKTQLSDNEKVFRGGYYFSSTNCAAYFVKCTQTSVLLESAQVNNSDRKSATTTAVYYR